MTSSETGTDIPRARKAVVVGGGPVGCLAAIALAKMGWRVELYEGRPDMRLPSSKAAAQQRSINLAMSSRGIAALQSILDPEATARFLQSVIPMRGRMIHHVSGNLESQLYDRHGQCINSIDRALLNENLLDETLSVPNVSVFFKHKIQAIDFDTNSMTTRDLAAGEDRVVPFDLCIGADGSYSVVRRQLQRVVRMDYQQTYIPHEYVELKMPAGEDDHGQPSFLLDPNHLHIWPRHSFMLIALPNKDRTFTCTLFAPTTSFEQLAASSRTEQLAWFRQQFPDALAHIGEDRLLADLERNPRSPLISIKANPYHYKDCAIILGDAAHSMVPFYGQGLNAGLEDVRVLTAIFRGAAIDGSVNGKEDNSIDSQVAAALRTYSETRHEDLVAICDLAMANYKEMRHDVTTPTYLFRKALDNMLSALSTPTPLYTDSLSVGADGAAPTVPAALCSALAKRPFLTASPRGWLPLYTMVTFRPDIAYAVVQRKAEWQGRVLGAVGWAVAGGVGAGGVFLAGWAAWTRRG